MQVCVLGVTNAEWLFNVGALDTVLNRVTYLPELICSVCLSFYLGLLFLSTIQKHTSRFALKHIGPGMLECKHQ